MEVPRFVQIAFILIVVFTIVIFLRTPQELPLEETKSIDSSFIEVSSTGRVIKRTTSAILPIMDVVPNTDVLHLIALDEIRQGCSRQDCIPSIDDPEFISAKEALKILNPDQIGIALSYKGEERFYPFSMLVTHELVNDVVAGDPLLISYCPLCGTGVVFSRTIDGVVFEFGVSGMLWQSNLLMYNRADSVSERSLWSQVLGQAVVGKKSGQQLSNIPSDIMKFDVWASQFPDGLVLDSGSQRDPYNGQYYEVAKRFAPDFDAETSPFAPDMYVYGIELNGTFKAYPRDLLPEGTIRDMIGGTELIITNNNGRVTFTDSNGTRIADTEGFWFSWVAVHPQTDIWTQ